MILEEDQKNICLQLQSLSTKPSLNYHLRDSFSSRSRSSDRSSGILKSRKSKNIFKKSNYDSFDKQNIQQEYGISILQPANKSQQMKLIRKINFIKSQISDVENSLQIYFNEQQLFIKYMQFMKVCMNKQFSQAEYSAGYSQYNYLNQLQQYKIVKGQLRRQDLASLQINRKVKRQIQSCQKQIRQKQLKIKSISQDICNSYIYQNKRSSSSKLKRNSFIFTKTKHLGNYLSTKISNILNSIDDSIKKIVLFQSKSKSLGIQLQYSSGDKSRKLFPSKYRSIRQISIDLDSIRSMTVYQNLQIIQGIEIQTSQQLIFFGKRTTKKSSFILPQNQIISGLMIYQINLAPCCFKIKTSQR